MSHAPKPNDSHGHDAHGHDSHDSPEVIRQHIKIFWGVFGTLVVLSVVTLALFYIDIKVVFWAVLVGLAVASVKASLVAGFFMHLLGEVKIIWATLAITAFMFGVLLVVSLSTNADQFGEHIAPPVKQITVEHEHEEEGEHEEHAEEEEEHSALPSDLGILSA